MIYGGCDKCIVNHKVKLVELEHNSRKYRDENNRRCSELAVD